MGDPREVLSRPAPPPDATVRYGPGPDHVADLRLPGSAAVRPAALVLLLHGGFWRAEYDRTHLGPMATALAEEGYAVCVPEFRRTGQPGGGWPGTFDDIAVATDALPSIIASAAPGVVDVGRIALVGHSAGGHLASWAAARHRLPETSPWRRTSPLPVRGVLSLAGISDVGACARLELDDRAAQLLLGGDPEEVPERFAIADPMSLLPSGLRTVLLHGENDQQVPPELNVRYAEAARLAGDDTELRLLSGVEHFALIDPLSPVWSVVLSTLEGLFSPERPMSIR